MIFGSTRLLSLRRIRARLAGLGGRGDRADLLDQPRAHLERRHEQLAESLRAPEAGDVVEDVGDVGRDLLVGREDPDVLVVARGRGVVVARADVDVAPQPARLAADDERHLGVDLHVREAVDDVHARLLQLARPLDVAPLVEAGLQLDEAHRLLAVLGAVDSAETSVLSSEVRYTAVFIAITSGSSAAAATNASKLVRNDSYG